MKQRDLGTLHDMLRASELCISFVENMTEDEFLIDKKTLSAVTHQMLLKEFLAI